MKKSKLKIAAILACRNNSTRLYAKPLQILDHKKQITILDQIISLLKKKNIFDKIILSVANNEENNIYREVSKKNKVQLSFGPEKNVLKRLILSAKKHNVTTIFRVTSESPFIYHEEIKKKILLFKKLKPDALFFDDIIDGSGFEIISLKALEISAKFARGDAKEHVTKYIRKNKKKFNIIKIKANRKLFRKDLRLTVDNPEDLIVCREIYKKFKNDAPLFSLKKIINFLDNKPSLKKLLKKYTSEGYKTMYI